MRSQTYLDRIKEWTDEAQMALNTSKTKYMVVNFTNKFQFNTRIELQNCLLEEVTECRLLGLTFNNQLSWAKNSENIVKRANAKMIMLHKLYEFNVPVEEMINIYLLFIRSMLEYCCVVWHSSISEDDCSSIERVQKTALRIILKEDFLDYQSALNMTGLDTLKERRTQLSLTFAKKCLKNDQMANLFPLNMKTVNTKPHEKFHVIPGGTFNYSYLQRLLNKL